MKKRWLAVARAGVVGSTSMPASDACATLRGLFWNLAAHSRVRPDARDELFVTGAFSLLDRITVRRSQLMGPVDGQRTKAIVQGGLTSVPPLIEAIERSDPMATGPH
jgi:hypothetical protein